MPLPNRLGQEVSDLQYRLDTLAWGLIAIGREEHAAHLDKCDHPSCNLNVRNWRHPRNTKHG